MNLEKNHTFSSPSLPLHIFGLLALLCILFIWQGLNYVKFLNHNQTIANFIEGKKQTLLKDEPVKLQVAKAYFLSQKGRYEEAGKLLDDLSQDQKITDQAALFYNRGNAKLNLTFELLENSNFDRAVPVVELAKDFYRQALSINPEFLDAKFNLEIAMRIVRDLPLGTNKDDRSKAKGKKIWTTMPGFPRGLP